MFLSDASIRRPIAMSCLIIGLTLLGLNSYRKMGLELMPTMDVPFITVTTIYPGASPEQIETDVAKRIEDQVVTIDGLKHVSSSCMENVCLTFLEFELDVDVDIAATDVREKLDLIGADFPEDVEDPKILKFDINATAIIHLALTGDVSLDELYDFADNTLRDRITVIPGVANVELIGGAEREVHVMLDPDALAAKGLSSMDVVSAIGNGVRTIPSGHLKDAGREYSVKFDAEYDT
ncbi:MAG TPA: efflux RND transporter permease subunit, partial [Phycisphaerales bacterium]|nr:efflux RND transporter permease subunit [Phycisphaerales bacterium]